MVDHVAQAAHKDNIAADAPAGRQVDDRAVAAGHAPNAGHAAAQRLLRHARQVR